MKIIFFSTFLSLFLVSASATESIQGKRYIDPITGDISRINGYYDINITNEIIEAYLAELKEAVKSNDPDKIAAFIAYPCYFNGPQKIKNKTAFKKLYPQLFTQKIKTLILEATLEELFVRPEGFMMGNGEIWFVPRRGITSIRTNL